ncbi:hypothetical protein KSS87_008684 [Heliosperma pusillum]|nr:hypothetical protein KSS87_008684 [Heliosperma pusillum]
METRNRKRVDSASSSSSSAAGPTTRASKRTRIASPPSASAPVTRSRTRARLAAANAAATTTSAAVDAMDAPTSSRRRSADKGKEKEHEVRVRVLETEAETELETERKRLQEQQQQQLNIDVMEEEEDEEEEEDDDDDDDDSEEGGGGNVGLLHQNLTSASSALQGLLRKLGAGLDDLLPSSAMGGLGGLGAVSSSQQSGRLKKILTGLRAEGEDGKQVVALTQLCELLSIWTEDSLSTISVDSFVPVLVGLLNHESNPDIMLLAARAITHLVDGLPSSTAAVVHYGAVNCFCARLLTIEYMDLAEQSLQALKKISQEHPTACLRAGALMAVLSYLDFFSTGRVALSTAANMCKKLPSDAADFVMEAVPHLTNLLQYQDAKVLEHASVCLTRIVEAFATSSDKLDELCNHGLVTQASSLISASNSGGGQASLSTSTYTGLIRLLSTCANGSTVGAKTLLLLGISGILKDILVGSGLVGNMSVSPALSRPPEQICEIVNLANELLPPLPQGTISLPASSNLFARGPLLKKSPTSSSTNQDETNGNTQDISAREKLLNDQPELLQQFGMDLLPVLIQIYGSSVNGPVRHKCLSVIGKLMYFSNADMISSLNTGTNISSFLAGVLAWKDPQVLVPALQIAEILMEKLPETFSKLFVREGVVHAVDSLIPATPSSSILPQPATPDKDNDSTPGVSARVRRSRRRSENQQQDANTVEESTNSVSIGAGSPSGSVEIPSVGSKLRSTVSASAKSLRNKYFPSDPGAVDVGISDDLLHLKTLCARLNTGVEEQRSKSKGKFKTLTAYAVDFSVGKEESLVGIVSEMLAELSKGDGVSTFEFIGSGVVAALLNYFSCGYFSKEKMSGANLPKLRQQALRRYKSFISVALTSSINEGNRAPMTVLVQKLQNALSSLERFPVVLSHSARSSGGSSRLSSGLSALSQPFKLRLCRAQGEKSLRDYSNTIVLIDPLASLAAVEDFLWPRVQRGDSGQRPSTSVGNSDSGATAAGAGASSPVATTPPSSRRQSSRSKSGVNIGDTSRKDSSHDKTRGSLKGKGKAILRSATLETKGPQTRNAARRKAVSEKDAKMKSTNEESGSEDKDLDMSPDDGLVMEDDDISDDEDEEHENVLRDDTFPMFTSNKVHDVKLSDSADDTAPGPVTSDCQTTPASGSSNKEAAVKGLDSTDFRSGGSFGSRGAMSFAAAAMAGIASNSRGIKGSRDHHGRSLGGSSDPPKLTFSAGGKQLNSNMTIYQAIQRQLVTNEEEDERHTGCDFVTSDGTRLWSDIYTITYQRGDSEAEKSSTGILHSGSSSKYTQLGSTSSSHCDAPFGRSLLDSILQGELSCDMEKNNPTYDILSLLRVLEGLNQLAPRLRVQSASDNFSEGMITSLDEMSATGSRVPTTEFVNSKLTPKLARQMQDALALCSGSLPSWCYQLTKACPFLFPFETRRQFFYSTAFGLSRALHRLQQQGADGQGLNGRLQRQKVRLSRSRILDSAAKVMEMYSSQKAVLEVEYFGEVGTGLGPTLEFYTLLSHDLQKVDLGIWRANCSFDKASMEVLDDDHSKDGKLEDSSGLGSGPTVNIVLSPLGLFPRPWPPNADSAGGSQFCKVIEYFRLLGRVMAKALQDGRLLDIPLSMAFYKLVLGQELDLHDILSFDPEIGKTLQELQALVCRKQYLESVGGDHSYAIAELCFRGASFRDLCLDFTLPGYPDYVLKPGDENVDIDNLEEYISLVVDATVKTGILRQLEAFRAGFNQVFDITSLQIFYQSEIDYLLCGHRELWKAETLVDHIKFDHGYTAKSPAIINLLEIMGEFTAEQQRAFCQFVTGAPMLPPGGLAVLNPKLTIHSSSGTTAANGTGASESSDDDLPSVMTCANYLKLPPYSTKEVMYKKLLFAIYEGQGSFDLS